MNKPLNPASVYQETRPKDWMPMPEPKDDELYLLMSVEDIESANFELSVRCKRNYLVEVWEVCDGKIYQYAYDIIISGEECTVELFPKPSHYSLVNKPTQVMVRIFGKNISEVLFFGFEDCDILEIHGKLPKVKYIKFLYLKRLLYFTLEGENRIKDMSHMFSYCKSLIAVLELDTKNATDMSSMFYHCESLEEIPEMDTKRVKDMSNMFWGCYKLKKVPMLDTQNVINMYAMFFNCFSLKEVPKLNTRSAKNMSHIFDEDLDIKKIQS